MGHFIFQDLLIIFAVAVPIGVFFRKIGLPTMIGFLVTGALIGPFGLGLIHEKAQIDILAEIGVTLLLFSVGLEFSFENLGELKKQGIWGGLLQISGTILAGALIGWLLGWGLYRSLYFGCLLSLSSTAIVISSLFERKLLFSLPGRLSTTILILQDLALIPMIVLLTAAWQNVGAELGKAAVFFLSVWLFSRFLFSPILLQVSRAKSRELFVITVILTALGMSWISYQLGLSFALGAFIGGVMIGTTTYKYQALAEISPLRYSFNSLFFVSIGMLLNFHFIRENYGLILLLILLIPMLKGFIAAASVYCVRIPLRLAIIVGIFLGQIGEFSFLLAYIGVKTGVIAPFLYDLIVTSAVMAMLLTPLMIQNAHGISDWLLKIPLFKILVKKKPLEILEKETAEMKDHVIICGYGPAGKTLGKMLAEKNIPYVVLELNPETVFRLKRKERRVYFGDGTSEEILCRSNIESAKVLAIAVPDTLSTVSIIYHARKLNPKIRIISRSKSFHDVPKQKAAGAHIVVAEDVEGGIEMGRLCLLEMAKVFPSSSPR